MTDNTLRTSRLKFTRPTAAPIAIAALSACIGLGIGFSTGRAHAQVPGDVEVNLEALGLGAPSSTQTEPRLILRYPGSQTATRPVPLLRYPNVPEPAPRPTPPKATASTNAEKPAPAQAAQKAPAPKVTTPVAVAPTTPTPAPVPAPVQVTQPAPKTAPQEEPAARSTHASSSVPAPAPAPTSEAPATPAAIVDAPAAPLSTTPKPAGQTQVASLEQPATTAELSDPEPAILRVVFDQNTAAIIGTARNELDAVAESLRYDPRRIELKAFGGTPGDKTSGARRLSLKRGLAVRAYLIGLGIDSRRIDVRALGGITDTGAPDRVDLAYSGS